MQMISSATVIRMKGEGLTVFEQDIVNKEIQKMQQQHRDELAAQKRMTQMAESSVSRKNREKLAQFEKAEQKEIGKLMIAWAMVWYFADCIVKGIDNAVWAIEDACVSAHKRFKRMQKKVRKARNRVLNKLIAKGVEKGWIVVVKEK